MRFSKSHVIWLSVCPHWNQISNGSLSQSKDKSNTILHFYAVLLFQSTFLSTFHLRSYPMRQAEMKERLNDFLSSLAPILVFFRMRLNTSPNIELWLKKIIMNHSLIQKINGLLYSHFLFLPKIKWKTYFDGDFSEIPLCVYIYNTYIITLCVI